eukprot:TRINITY_DN92779_c0_g1_i1.p1 TRINITY_DN92779_c0_g1~~TRINITY_DN92779_c0_g1_i1.p1  ORF type:complete len:399 (-),score=129.05 TRINITY_DN92779_c0_g1_i1:98-1294(-)
MAISSGSVTAGQSLDKERPFRIGTRVRVQRRLNAGGGSASSAPFRDGDEGTVTVAPKEDASNCEVQFDRHTDGRRTLVALKHLAVLSQPEEETSEASTTATPCQDASASGASSFADAASLPERERSEPPMESLPEQQSPSGEQESPSSDVASEAAEALRGHLIQTRDKSLKLRQALMSQSEESKARAMWAEARIRDAEQAAAAEPASPVSPPRATQLLQDALREEVEEWAARAERAEEKLYEMQAGALDRITNSYPLAEKGAGDSMTPASFGSGPVVGSIIEGPKSMRSLLASSQLAVLRKELQQVEEKCQLRVTNLEDRLRQAESAQPRQGGGGGGSREEELEERLRTVQAQAEQRYARLQAAASSEELMAAEAVAEAARWRTKFEEASAAAASCAA